MLIVILCIGIITGIIFTTILSKTDQTLVEGQLSNFFLQVKNGKINYQSGILNSLSSNLLYAVGIWLLGISIIGLPIIIFLLFMKGFVFGFSVASIIRVYQWKGIIGSLTYTFPHHFLSILLSIFLSFYAVSFSIKLFSMLFLKKEINFKEAMRRYFKVLMICVVGFIIVSIIEIYFAPILMKLFTNLIK